VEGSCEHGNEPSGYIKCWKIQSGRTTGDFCWTSLHGITKTLLRNVISVRPGSEVTCEGLNSVLRTSRSCLMFFLCFMMFVNGMYSELIYCFIFQLTFLFNVMDAVFFITFIF
jgi:hypothetical protein